MHFAVAFKRLLPAKCGYLTLKEQLVLLLFELNVTWFTAEKLRYNLEIRCTNTLLKDIRRARSGFTSISVKE
jgi:hypothetical protein